MNPQDHQHQSLPAQQPIDPVRRLVARGHLYFWVIVVANCLPLILSREPLRAPGVASMVFAALLFCVWRGHRWAHVLVHVITFLSFLASFLIPDVSYEPLVLLLAFVLLGTKSMRAWLENQRLLLGTR